MHSQSLRPIVLVCTLSGLLAAGALPASADTLPVLPGESIQAQIDAANPGDIIAIFGGTYQQDVNVNQSVRLVEVSGQEVHITGTVTFTGLTDPPPFEGFTVGSSGKGIAVSNTTGLLIRDTQSTAGFGLQATGTSVAVVENCNLSSVTANSDRLEISNSTITGSVTQDGAVLNFSGSTVAGALTSTANAQETCCFRTTFGGSLHLQSQKAWFGYSKAWSFNFTGSNAKVAVVGSEMDRANAEYDGMNLQGSSNQYVIANCIVEGVRYRNFGTQNGIAIAGSGHEISIFNNYISLTRMDSNSSTQGNAVRVVGNPTKCRIYNNIMVGAWWGIDAPFGAEARNNLYWGMPNGYRNRGGILAQDELYLDPLFVPSEEPLLQPGSPCINAGIDDPIFNDLDDTRNDIGPGGGCWFDPDGWTTENPVVISYDLGPEQVLEGVDPEVILSGGKAVSQP